MNNEKTSYRYRVGFNQSLSTGAVAFEGVIQFDTLTENMDYSGELVSLIQDAEERFKENGYRVASDITPKIIKEKEIRA